MYFIEELKSYIFPDECGVEFCEASALDIEECLLFGSVVVNEDGGFDVEIDKVEAIIVRKDGKEAVIEGHLDVTKTLSRHNLEDFREEMIKHALSMEPVENWGKRDYDRADFDI
jgi:hypothetical protein